MTENDFTKFNFFFKPLHNNNKIDSLTQRLIDLDLPIDTTGLIKTRKAAGKNCRVNDIFGNYVRPMSSVLNDPKWVQ